MITKDQILEVLELRYDYYSARIVFAEASQKAQIATSKQSYSVEEVEALGNALSRIGDRLDQVLVALKGLIAAEKSKEESSKGEVLAQPAETDAATDAETPFPENEPQTESQPKKKKK